VEGAKVACLTHGTNIERGKMQDKQYKSNIKAYIMVLYTWIIYFRTIENKESNIIVIKCLTLRMAVLPAAMAPTKLQCSINH
jgi:hypothetical protein